MLKTFLVFALFFATGYTAITIACSQRMANLGFDYVEIDGIVTETNALPDCDFRATTDEGLLKTPYTLCLDSVFVNGKAVTVKVKMTLDITNRSPEARELKVGDGIKVHCALDDIPLEWNDGYAMSLVNAGYDYTATAHYSDLEIKHATHHRNDIRTRLTSAAKQRLFAAIGEEEGAVAYGMVFGGSSMLSETATTAYRDTGVLHLFSVSGLHISILAGALTYCLRKTKLKRIVSSVIVLCLLVFYCYLIGFVASAIRAITMYGIYTMATVFHRRFDSLNAISLAALLYLLFKPLALFSYSFLLSYGTMIGIIALAPSITDFFSILPDKINWLSKYLSVNLAATAAALPLSAVMFGQFSLVTIPANLLLIPISSILLVGIMLLVAVSLIIPAASPILIVLSPILRFLKSAGYYLSLGGAMYVKVFYGATVAVVISVLIFLASDFTITAVRGKRIYVAILLSFVVCVQIVAFLLQII